MPSPTIGGTCQTERPLQTDASAIPSLSGVRPVVKQGCGPDHTSQKKYDNTSETENDIKDYLTSEVRKLPVSCLTYPSEFSNHLEVSPGEHNIIHLAKELNLSAKCVNLIKLRPMCAVPFLEYIIREYGADHIETLIDKMREAELITAVNILERICIDNSVQLVKDLRPHHVTKLAGKMEGVVGYDVIPSWENLASEYNIPYKVTHGIRKQAISDANNQPQFITLINSLCCQNPPVSIEQLRMKVKELGMTGAEMLLNKDLIKISKKVQDCLTKIKQCITWADNKKSFTTELKILARYYDKINLNYTPIMLDYLKKKLKDPSLKEIFQELIGINILPSTVPTTEEEIEVEKIGYGCCFNFLFDPNKEDIIHENINGISIVNLEDSRKITCTRSDIHSRRFVQLKDLVNNESYHGEIIIQRKDLKSCRRIRIKEFVAVDEETCKFLFGIHGFHISMPHGNITNKVDTIIKFDQQSNICNLPIKVAVGAHKVELCTTISKWNDLCQTNFEQCYSRLSKYPTKIPGNSSNIKGLEDWINPSAFIFSGYNAFDHFQFLSYDIKNVHADLQSDVEQNSDRNLLVIDPNHHVILTIRISNVKLTLKNLRDELQLLENDVTSFACLHKDFLRDSGIFLIGILLLEKMTKGEFIEIVGDPSYTLPGYYMDIIITNEIYTSENKKLFEHRMNRIIRALAHQKGNIEERENKSFNFSACIQGFLASRDVSNLPGVYDSTDERTYKVILNQHQYDILSSSDKHIVIRGGYGSGKSLLIQIKLTCLAKSATDSTQIFLLCHDENTLLLSQMKVEAHKLMVEYKTKHLNIIVSTLKDLTKVIGLKSPAMLSKILKYIANQKCEKHLLLDEFDGTELIDQETKGIKEIANSTQMKEATILIGTKTLHKHRSGEEMTMAKGYHYEDTGMKVVVLDKTMRSPYAINELLMVSKKIIESYSSFIHYNKDYSHTEQSNQKTSTEESVIKEIVVKDLSNKRSSNKESDNKIISERDSEEMENVNSRRAATADNLDHLLAQSKEDGTHTLETNFEISGDAMHGHKIKGITPLLVYLFDQNQKYAINFNSVARMYFALDRVVEVNEGAIIICINHRGARLCLKAMQLMAKFNNKITYYCYLPTMPDIGIHTASQINTELFNDLKTVIISDVKGVEGMQFSKKVVVTVSPSEHILAHSVPAAISRALNRLYVLVLDKDESSKKHAIVEEIIQKWNDDELVEKCVIKIQEECGCNKREEFPMICKKQKKDPEEQTLCFHKHTEAYKSFNRYYESEINNTKDSSSMQDSTTLIHSVLFADENMVDTKMISSLTQVQKKEIIKKFDGFTDGEKKVDYVKDFIKRRDVDTFNMLSIVRGVELSTMEDVNQYTFLHMAGRYGALNIVSTLLKLGSNVNAMDVGHRTPLMYATMEGHTEVVRLMLIYNSDPSLTDDKGRSSLDWSKCKNRAGTLEVLQEHLINHDLQDKGKFAGMTMEYVLDNYDSYGDLKK